MALLRYRNAQMKSGPKIVLDASPEDIKQTWNVLARVVKGMEEFLINGGVPNVQDGMRAMKLQLEMMSRYGVDLNINASGEAKRMLAHLVDDIILPNVTDAQKVVIAEAIAADPELAEWVMAESE